MNSTFFEANHFHNRKNDKTTVEGAQTTALRTVLFVYRIQTKTLKSKPHFSQPVNNTKSLW